MQSFVGPVETVPIEVTDMDALEVLAALNAQDDDGQVLFAILPGSVAENRHLLDRTVG